jgi:ABC-type phosphate transport system substrate-binding protein
MKSLLILAITALSLSAQAKHQFAGSDTLAGAMTDAIIQSGMDSAIGYIGGGSGNGEKGLITGDQGIAPMSREMKPEALEQLKAQGNSVKAHVIALDGISLFVKKDNNLPSLDLSTLVRIYSCEYTKWEQVRGSNLKGDILVLRRNDQSGTTDAFKHMTGIKTFGACVKALEETADIAEVTSRDVMAIGYSGLSGHTDNNRSVAISKDAASAAVLPTTKSIRNFSYPLARKLYVYEVTGTRGANNVEKQLLDSVLDRSFMDPIAQAHEFITID